jgi:hypothetical protein
MRLLRSTIALVSPLANASASLSFITADTVPHAVEHSWSSSAARSRRSTICGIEKPILIGLRAAKFDLKPSTRAPLQLRGYLSRFRRRFLGRRDTLSAMTGRDELPRNFRAIPRRINMTHREKLQKFFSVFRKCPAANSFIGLTRRLRIDSDTLQCRQCGQPFPDVPYQMEDEDRSSPPENSQS